jgi:hypothetical protein
MKEFIYSNFQLTRSTGVPTMIVIDGVSVEMRRHGAPGTAQAKTAKAKRPRRPAAKESRAKERPAEQPAKTSKAAVRRTEAPPQ